MEFFSPLNFEDWLILALKEPYEDKVDWLHNWHAIAKTRRYLRSLTKLRNLLNRTPSSLVIVNELASTPKTGQ